MEKRRFIDLLFLGLFSLYLGLAVYKLTDPTLDPSPEALVVATPEASEPAEIVFPKLKKKLAVARAEIKDGQWQVFDDKVAWLGTSARPGEGNTILYAHNRRPLFGDLDELEIGDEIEVLRGEDWLKYKVSEVRRILPTDLTAVISTENRLTLYTCDGSFDQKRLVVYAEITKE